MDGKRLYLDTPSDNNKLSKQTSPRGELSGRPKPLDFARGKKDAKEPLDQELLQLKKRSSQAVKGLAEFAKTDKFIEHSISQCPDYIQKIENKAANHLLTIEECKKQIEVQVVYLEKIQLSEQKARVSRLCEEISSFSNISEEHKKMLNNIEYMQSSELVHFEIPQFVSYIDKLELLNLKAKGDQCLEAISKFPNIGEYLAWKPYLENTAKELLQTDDLSVNKDGLEKLKHLVGHFELDRDVFQRQAEANQYLNDISQHPNTHEYVKRWKPFLDPAANQILQTDDLSFKRQHLEEYGHHVEHLRLDRELFQRRAEANQYLNDISQCPNTHEYVNQQRKGDEQRKSALDQALQTADLASKQQRLEEYGHHVEHLRLVRDLCQKQMRAEQLLKQYFSKFAMLSKQNNPLIDKINNIRKIDISTFKDDRDKLTEFTNNIDQLELSNLKISMWEREGKASQFLADISKCPNTGEYVKEKRSILENIVGGISQLNDLTSGRQYTEQYQHYIAHLKLDRDLFQQQQRADQLLNKNRKYSNTSEYASLAKLKLGLDEKTVNLLQTSDTSSKNTYVENFKLALDDLEQKFTKSTISVNQLDKASSSSAYQVQDIASTNHSQKEKEKVEGQDDSSRHAQDNAPISRRDKGKAKMELEDSRPAKTTHDRPANADVIPAWDVTVKEVRIPVQTQIMDKLRKAKRDLRPHRPDRAKKLVNDIKAEHKKLEENTKQLEDSEMGRQLKSAITNRVKSIMPKVQEYYNKSINGYGSKIDKGRSSRERGEISLKVILDDFTKLNKDILEKPKRMIWEESLYKRQETFKKNKKMDLGIKPELGTDTKGKKEPNEDAYIVDEKHGRYGGVFDGVGGNKEGDIASKTAKDITKIGLSKLSDDMSLEEIKKSMKEILLEANQEILKKSTGMATTASIFYIMKDRTVVIANIGDSRIYLSRKDTKSIEHLTLDKQKDNDKSWDNQKIISNFESFEKAPYSLKQDIAYRNMIDEALGSKHDINPNIYSYPLVPDDMIIAMSDGIYDNLSDGKMNSCIQKNSGDVQNIANTLCQEANKVSKMPNLDRRIYRPKEDDMTVIVAKL